MPTHLSHDGYHAGLRYCGATDGTSCHLPYVTNPLRWAREHVECRECVAVLESSCLDLPDRAPCECGAEDAHWETTDTGSGTYACTACHKLSAET